MLDRAQKAARAKAILEDETFQEALDGVKRYHTSVFLRANATETEVLAARQRILALTEVANQLLKFFEDEVVAKERKEKHRGKHD
jgi:adenylosuccinate synthase